MAKNIVLIGKYLSLNPFTARPSQIFKAHTEFYRLLTSPIRNFESKPVENDESETNISEEHKPLEEKPLKQSYTDYRFLYPEFLPNPLMSRRHSVREKLERKDMLQRRSAIFIPEFYAGSILAVTASDLNAPGKKSRFVGICIERGEHGLRAFFTLRNVIEGQGIEITYDLYNPTILSIEVLKLEKRLDDSLLYLKDALPEYSTIPFDMDPVPHADGAPVPINPIKVKMKPRPWHARWERKNMKGMESVTHLVTEKMLKQKAERETPWERFDLMKEYRNTIPEEEQEEIFEETHQYHQQTVHQSVKIRRKRSLVRPKKTA